MPPAVNDDGQLLVHLAGADPTVAVDTELAAAVALADALPNPTVPQVGSHNLLWNLATWDRQRGNHELTLLASAARTSSATCADQVNVNHLGVVLWLKITARTVGAAPLVRFGLELRDPVSGSGARVVTGASFTPTVDVHVCVVYPGPALTFPAGNLQDHLLAPLPLEWAVTVDHVADITSMTYSLGGSYLHP